MLIGFLLYFKFECYNVFVVAFEFEIMVSRLNSKNIYLSRFFDTFIQFDYTDSRAVEVIPPKPLGATCRGFDPRVRQAFV